MYVVGHCVTSAVSGEFTTADVLGVGTIYLSLPDIVRCHEWGYANCFSLSSSTLEARLIKAHLLGDWFVHYGENKQAREKRGWAYRHMSAFAGDYEEFFQKAYRLGLTDSAQTKDTRPGFSHTMAEYSIDHHLAETGLMSDEDLLVIKRAFSGEEGSKGRGDRSDDVTPLDVLGATIDRFGIVCGRESLGIDSADFRARVMRARNLNDLMAQAGVKKFGLVPCDQSNDYVTDFVGRGRKKIGLGSLDDVVGQTSKFIGQNLR